MSTSTDLTPEEAEALRIMREIVAEKGADYVYPESEKREIYGPGSIPACAYARYENDVPVGPSCIVGHYLAATGSAPEELSYAEGSSAYCVVGAASERLRLAFSDAQGEQDSDATWGDALAVFERKLGVTA